MKVFLCHSSEDKVEVRKICNWLHNENFEPWLDEEQLIAGQDWRLEIKKAVCSSDAIIVCLSRNSVNNKGYFYKEMKESLDIAAEQPEGSIFIIPIRLENCIIPQWFGQFFNFLMIDRSFFYERKGCSPKHRFSYIRKKLRGTDK